MAYHIPVLECPGYEADDVIGTISKYAVRQGFEIFIVTPDKDFAQLVENGIFIYKPRKSGNDNEIWGVNEILKEFEVQSPNQVIDILALWGDAADNIPGAPGIGEKSAKKLIAEYGSIENLLSNTDKLKGKQKETLESFKEQVILSKSLATINTKVPIDINLDDMIYTEADKELLKTIFNELDFKNLSKRLLDSDESVIKQSTQGSLFDLKEPQKKQESKKNVKHFNSEEVNYQLINSQNEIDLLVNRLLKTSKFCFDTETTGLNTHRDEIVGLALCFNEFEAFYIPFNTDYNTTKNILNRFSTIFSNENILKIGHNIKFDAQILFNYGIKVRGPYFDTMVAHYLLNPEGRHKLDFLSEEILNYEMIHIEELIGKKGREQLNMRDISVDKVKDYACEDADITFRLFNILNEKINQQGLKKLSEEIEMPLIGVLCDIELTGFNIDTKALKEYESVLGDEIVKIEEKIYEVAGEKFNISSPRQLGIILFEKLKISTNIKLTKTKQYSTSEDVLQQLYGSHPIIAAILDYRGLTKLQSTYVTNLPNLLDPETKRIHTSFNQTIAATGRLTSMNPNLQNIPIREEKGREIRKSFIAADENHILLSADYSQIELRLMAHMSGDEDMINAFLRKEDIHQSTAAKIFKVKPHEVTREMRSKAKTANFGIIYGISAFGLSQRLNIPRVEAKYLIDNYFISFPKVKHYIDKSIEEAKSKGYVATLFGRKRFLPDILSSNSVVRGVAERNAVNTPIQGTAADIIKIAMISIFKKLENNFKTKMILQVHDELIFDVFKPELEKIKEIVKYEMEHAAKLLVPLEVEIGVGKNWFEAH